MSEKKKECGEKLMREIFRENQWFLFDQVKYEIFTIHLSGNLSYYLASVLFRKLTFFS